MSALGAIIRKDLRTELRTGDSTVALSVMSLLVLLIMVMAFNPGAASRNDLAAGALWVALIFSGMLGANKTLLSELENGCVSGLLMSPADRATVFVAKLVTTSIFMVVAEAVAIVLLMLFFNLDPGPAVLRLLLVVILGMIGFAAVSTLLTSVSSHTRAGGLLLPLLVVPLFVPPLIAGVKASGAVLAGLGLGAAAAWLKILVAFDVLFVTAGYLLFEYVIRED